MRQLIAAFDLAHDAKGVVGLGEAGLVDALLPDPVEDALVVDQLEPFLVQGGEHRLVEPLELADRFKRVIELGEVGVIGVAEGDMHAAQLDVTRFLGAPGFDDGVEVGAVRAAVGEELEDFDLARAVGRHRRLDH